jgi:hypothetical protein
MGKLDSTCTAPPPPAAAAAAAAAAVVEGVDGLASLEGVAGDVAAA